MDLITLVGQFSPRGILGLLPTAPAPVGTLGTLGMFVLFDSSRKTDVYNILWALVFGFATLNILSLIGKRFDPDRHRMSFGEMMAIATVLVAVTLLGWEMLYLFHVFPIRLSVH